MPHETNAAPIMPMVLDGTKLVPAFSQRALELMLGKPPLFGRLYDTLRAVETLSVTGEHAPLNARGERLLRWLRARYAKVLH